MRFFVGGGGQNRESIFKELVEYFPIEYRDLKKSVSKAEFKVLLNHLLSDSSFIQVYSNYLSGKVSLLRKYIQQELCYSAGSIAFVDFQGKGTSMECLARIMQIHPPEQLPVYYMFSSAHVMPSIQKGMYTASSLAHVEMELFCRTTHGQTLGYTEDGDKIIPILESGEDKLLIEWGYEDYLCGIHDFVLRMCQENVYSFGDGFSLYNLYAQYLGRPLDRDTTEILASIPFTSSTKGKDVGREYAPRITLLDLIVDYARYREIHCSSNYVLSMKRSSPLLWFLAVHVAEGNGFLHDVAVRFRDILKK